MPVPNFHLVTAMGHPVEAAANSRELQATTLSNLGGIVAVTDTRKGGG
jgi:hypothetical protein